MTTRAIDPATGAFGAKTRAWDARDEGPARIEDLRREWQKRVNRMLEKAGHEGRIDMRSYEAQAAAGDAPEGLVAQDHLGPKWAALSRKMTGEDGEDRSRVGRRRAARRASNEGTWTCWLQLRALERERARETRSAAIAAEREAERRTEAAAERARLETARTEQERAEAAAAAVHLCAPRRAEDAWLAAIRAAQATGDGGAGDAAWKAAQRPVRKPIEGEDDNEDPGDRLRRPHRSRDLRRAQPDGLAGLPDPSQGPCAGPSAPAHTRRGLTRPSPPTSLLGALWGAVGGMTPSAALKFRTAIRPGRLHRATAPAAPAPWPRGSAPRAAPPGPGPGPEQRRAARGVEAPSAAAHPRRRRA